MTHETLDVRTSGDVAVVTIRRPERRNALDGPLWAALRETAESLAKQPPRVVVLTGAGGHFSAGMDLGMDNPLLARLLPAMMEKNERVLETLIRELKDVPDAFARIPCPVIAAIEGACAGGGMELALACDLRVAARDAFFSLPETRVGMIPDVGGTVRSVRLLGRTRAAELILTGRRVTADEAGRWGLVNHVCETGEAVRAAEAIATEIAKNAPIATREVLRVLRSADVLDTSDAFTLETRAGVAALCSGECVEGTRAFLEKRPPKWT